MIQHKLTARQVEAAKPKANGSAQFAGDGAGLWLQVSSWKGRTSKSWIHRYTSPTKGRVRSFGLGPYPLISLAAARELNRKAALAVIAGLDPIDERQRERQARVLASTGTITFEKAAVRCIEMRSAGWRSAKHARQWLQSLRDHAFPVIGRLNVDEIDNAAILRVLAPIWKKIPVTASRIRQRCEIVIDFARVSGFINHQKENPARWGSNLEHALAAPTSIAAPVHLSALKHGDLPGFFTRLRDVPSKPARALEFSILTAARSGEVLHAHWSEIEGTIWTIPASRMKSKRPHRVPLASAALAVLAGQPRTTEFIFASIQTGGPLGHGSMRKVLTELGAAATVHGFRSSFRDWAAERTGVAREVVEAALAHVVGDKTEAAYKRTDLFEKRRKLMEAWASYVTTPVPAGDVVVPFEKAVRQPS
jgi:integrase